jgi:hypothetical protein
MQGSKRGLRCDTASSTSLIGGNQTHIGTRLDRITTGSAVAGRETLWMLSRRPLPGRALEEGSRNAAA